jgi:uncharacterized protein (DUF1800 family)
MVPSGKIEWNSEAAAHLLRRAAFGGLPEDADALAKQSLEGAVDSLLKSEEQTAWPVPATDPQVQAKERLLRKKGVALSEEARREIGMLRRSESDALRDLRYWWLDRMRSSVASVREKLTLFWHGHFATSETKVRFVHAMWKQNDTLRQMADGPFADLCHAMAVDPAMLIWLDGRQSEAKSPNENFAREVMELFTLGEGHYTEEDIREAARSFTGWRVDPQNCEAVFTARRFDDGRKKLFGKSGNFGARETVEILCAQPRCAEFLAAKLWEFYAYPQPGTDLIKSLAAHYRRNDLSTRELLRMIFTHPEFYSLRARASQVKSPVQWMIQVARETGRQLLPPQLALPLASELGQNLFMPPSVKGWDGGTTWINSATLIRRSNTAILFATAAPPLPVEAESMDEAAWIRVAPPETRSDQDALAERLQKVFLAAPAGSVTRRRLESVIAESNFPCGDDTVREASVVLLGCPEYNLC